MNTEYPWEKSQPMNEEPLPVPFTYPWYEAPDWANWAATDEDGRAWWYSEQPKLDKSDDYRWGGVAAQSSAQRIYGSTHPQAATRWKESLQQRPHPKNEEPCPTPPAKDSALTALRTLTPATLDALSNQDLEDFNRLCNLWNTYSTELLDRRSYQ